MTLTRPTRMPELNSNDRSQLDALLDRQYVAHIGAVVDGQSVVMPTLCARDGDELLLHGSTGSRWMRSVTDGQTICVEVTEFGGIVVARSAFESSIVYASAMVFGVPRRLPADQLSEALDLLTNRVLPGRTAEVRASTPKEIAATMVLAVPLTEWSLRVNDGFPEDPDADIAGDAWAGQVRFSPGPVQVLASPDLRAGIGVPASVQALVSID